MTDLTAYNQTYTTLNDVLTAVDALAGAGSEATLLTQVSLTAKNILTAASQVAATAQAKAAVGAIPVADLQAVAAALESAGSSVAAVFNGLAQLSQGPATGAGQMLTGLANAKKSLPKT